MLLLKIMGICKGGTKRAPGGSSSAGGTCTVPYLFWKIKGIFFPIMFVRTKLIVLTVLSDDYFKLISTGQSKMGGKKGEEKVEGGKPPTTSTSKTIVNFQKCKDDNWLQLGMYRLPI